MSKLKHKVAIVTGASKGIGAGIACQLAADGAKVVVNYASSNGGADKVVADIEAAGGKAVAVGADVRNKAEVEALVKAAIDNFGRLDIVVNNSGIYQFAEIEETTEELYRKQFDINVLGPLLLAGAASPHLGKGGSIINKGKLVICECVFRNEGALEAALASPEVAAVMADVPRFTALAPQRVRVAAL